MANSSKKTATEDPRFQQIKAEQVYGLYHDEEIIYVGCTTNPLERRLHTHRQRARDGTGSPIYTYIREEVDNPREDLSIEVIPYDSEEDALDQLGDDVLNVDKATEGDYRGHQWTTDELDVLEECDSIREAQEELGLSQTQIRNAMLKLGMIEHTRFEEWTDEEIDLLGTMTDKELSKKIDRTRGAISQKRQEMGISGYRSRPLSPADVVEICRRYYFEDVTYADIAEDYGVAGETIGRVVRGESYTDVYRPDFEKIDAFLDQLIKGVLGFRMGVVI